MWRDQCVQSTARDSACLCAALSLLCLWLRLWGKGALKTSEVSKLTLDFADQGVCPCFQTEQF